MGRCSGAWRPSSGERSTLRCRRSAQAVDVRASRSVAACLPALTDGLDRPGGVPLGLPADLPAPLLQLEWCAAFVGPVRAALHGLKYGGERRLVRPLADALAARWRNAGAGGDMIVPVPVHPTGDGNVDSTRPSFSPTPRRRALASRRPPSSSASGRPSPSSASRARLEPATSPAPSGSPSRSAREPWTTVGRSSSTTSSRRARLSLPAPRSSSVQGRSGSRR